MRSRQFFTVCWLEVWIICYMDLFWVFLIIIICNFFHLEWIIQEREADAAMSYKVALEVWHFHFCHILFVGILNAAYIQQEGNSSFTFLMREMSKNFYTYIIHINHIPVCLSLLQTTLKSVPNAPWLLVFTALCNFFPCTRVACVTNRIWQKWWFVTSKASS